MRLTTVLNVIFPRKRLYGGLVYGGKNQKVKPLKTSYKIEAANQVAMEAQNLIYLNKPYLSLAEQTIYGKHYPIRAEKRKAFMARKIKERGFFPNRTLQEHLEPLNQNKKWE